MKKSLFQRLLPKKEVSMHVICDRCFKLAGPLEELCLGVVDGVSQCAYCGSTLRGWAHRQSHRLSGEGPDPRIRRTLENIWLAANSIREAEDKLFLEAIAQDAVPTVRSLKDQN